MSTVEPGGAPPPKAPQANPLVERIKGLILKPAEEWAKIEPERPTLQSLFLSYVMPLAAIPVIASVIGSLVFGYANAGMVLRPGPMVAILGGVVQYVLSVGAVYVVGLIIDVLAPSFDARRDQMQAMKLAAYSGTAGWLAGIFWLFPPLSMLSIVGLYSIFLLYRGLPRLMRAPEGNLLAYTGAVVAAVVVAVILLAALAGCVIVSLF